MQGMRRGRVGSRGQCQHSAGGVYCRVADGGRTQRQRFTIAHELGHFLLHEGITNHVDRSYRVNFRSAESSQATNVEEIEANYFAASILMPKHMLDARNAEEALDNDAMVGALAREFHVSRLAMSLRLANLYEQATPF